jgi:6-pyruvoyltetrahydropterin/6-carboxytetrahydropterin synthase
VIETWVDGPISPETGYVLDLKILKEIIRSEVTDKFDHRNLNLDLTEFNGIIPTAENIALVSWHLMRKKIPANLELTVRIWETENNVVEYNGK